MKTLTKHYNISIYGHVQGVFFRASAKAVADQLGVKGFILNRPDGSVYSEAEGDDFALDMFLDFCRSGPENSSVHDVKVEESDMKNFLNFEILKR